jgi:hypothetical protein
MEKKRRIDPSSGRSSKTDDFIHKAEAFGSEAPTGARDPVLPQREAFAQPSAPSPERFEQKLD